MTPTRLQDYQDTFILSRHEIEPIGADLDRLKRKEEAFERWRQRAERVRDIIQNRRRKQQKEIEIRQKIKAVSQLMRVFGKVAFKKSILENQRVQMRTMSLLGNSPKGTAAVINKILTPDEMSDINETDLMVNLSVARYSLKGSKSKAHRKFLTDMISKIEKTLTNRGVPINQESLNQYLQSLPPERVALHQKKFNECIKMSGRR